MVHENFFKNNLNEYNYLSEAQKKYEFSPTNEPNIFVVWTGPTPMSARRKSCLDSIIEKTGCRVTLITPENLNDFVVSECPLHPGYKYLSEVHRSDYLRAYFLHFYGGGYTDIKMTFHDWRPSFERLMNDPDKWIMGYQEVAEMWVAQLPGILGEILRRHWQLILGSGEFISKPRTPFTHDWMFYLHEYLNNFLPDLEKYPARFARDHYLAEFEGTQSLYPISWTAIGGNIGHPLCIKYCDKLLYGLPLPSFQDYT